MTNDLSEHLPAAAPACGCAVCECGEACACAPAAAPCHPCEDAGCGCCA